MTYFKQVDFELSPIGKDASSSSNIPNLDASASNGSVATVQVGATSPGSGLCSRRYLNAKRTTTGNSNFGISFTGVTSIRIRFYWTWITYTSAQGSFLALQQPASNRAQIFFNNFQNVQLRNITTAVGSASANALVLGRRYRYEWRIDGPNGQQRLIIYEPDETTQFYDSGNVTFTSNNTTTFLIGNLSSATYEYNIDNIIVSDQVNEIGPAGNNAFGFNVQRAA